MLRQLFCIIFVCLFSNLLIASPSKTEEAAKLKSSSTTAMPEKKIAMDQNFLEENKKQANIKVLPSGLQFKVVREGQGQSPGPTDFVTVHYRGTLVNGTEFDSSYSRNEPATFAVNAVIPGWTEALQLMKPGSKWTIYVPPTLAYGERGAGNKIGPNAVLVFDIELLHVKSNEEDNLGGQPEEWEDSD